MNLSTPKKDQASILGAILLAVAGWGFIISVVWRLHSLEAHFAQLDQRVAAIEETKSDRGHLSPTATVEFRWWREPNQRKTDEENRDHRGGPRAFASN